MDYQRKGELAWMKLQIFKEIQARRERGELSERDFNDALVLLTDLGVNAESESTTHFPAMNRATEAMANAGKCEKSYSDSCDVSTPGTYPAVPARVRLTQLRAMLKPVKSPEE